MTGSHAPYNTNVLSVNAGRAETPKQASGNQDNSLQVRLKRLKRVHNAALASAHAAAAPVQSHPHAGSSRHGADPKHRAVSKQDQRR